MMRPRFTNAGRELHLRALAGVELVFTKMQLGDGVLNDTNYLKLNALISPKATLSLSAIKISDGSATIRGAFSNRNMIEGFDYRELGLFARDPDNPENEILYCYANFGNEYQHIAEPSSALIERTVRINVTVDDAPNVSAVINDSAMYVDHAELMQVIEEHNTSEGVHANMLDFDVTYYIDCTSDEEESLRNGEYEHPFISIQEAIDFLPMSALRVKFTLKTGGKTYDSPDEGFVFVGFHSFVISYDGEKDSRTTIAGPLAFRDCGNVCINNIEFISSKRFPAPTQLSFVNCSHVFLETLRGAGLDDDCVYIRADNSTVVARDLTVMLAYRVIYASFGSRVYLIDSVIAGGTVGIEAINGAEIHAIDVTNDYVVPSKATLGGIIVNDGVMSVSHGGTGVSQIDKGALLKGGSESEIEQILGVGALFASKHGEPRYGTLPIELGGTGMTDDGTYIQSTLTSGIKHGSVKLPGGIVIMWGKINSGGLRNYEHNFNQYNHNRFCDGHYIFVFSGQDNVWGSVSKNADGFSVEVGGIAAGSYVADWIAIGMGG